MLKYQRQVVYGVLSRLLSLNPFRSFDLQRCLRFHFIFQLWRKVTSRQRQRNWREKVSFPPQVRRGNKERLLYRIFKVFICYINSWVENKLFSCFPDIPRGLSAGKPIGSVVYCFYDINMFGAIWQDENMFPVFYGYISKCRAGFWLIRERTFCLRYVIKCVRALVGIAYSCESLTELKYFLGNFSDRGKSSYVKWHKTVCIRWSFKRWGKLVKLDSLKDALV